VKTEAKRHHFLQRQENAGPIKKMWKYVLDRAGEKPMGIETMNCMGGVDDEVVPQGKSGKRLELLVNNVYDIIGLRRSLKESKLIADFCTTVTVSLLPEEVLLTAARKLYEYFQYKIMVFSPGATDGDHAEGFFPGDPSMQEEELKTLLQIFPGLKKERVKGYASLGLTCPDDHRDSGFENYFMLPFMMGSVVFITDSDLNCAFDPSFLDKIMEIFATSLQNAREYGRVKEQSMRDSLTGLFNRRVLVEMLELEDHKREASPLSLLVLDLDNFKAINDTYGHPAGDLVLQKVGKVLRDNARGSDLIVRNGGEEFAVLLPSSSASVAFEVGERLRKSLEKATVVYNNRQINFSASVGIAHSSGKEAFPVKELIEQADQALYQAKKNGKNRVCFHSVSPVLIGRNVIPETIRLV
jgi:two-component system cell cycle response regulator